MIYSKVEDILSRKVDLVWEDERQHQLEQYLNTLGSVLTPSNFYNKVDWEYLAKALNCEDVKFIKSKADYIYDDLFNPFKGESELDVEGYFRLWKNEDHKILEEALVTIKDLHLNPFNGSETTEGAGRDSADRDSAIEYDEVHEESNRSNVQKNEMVKSTMPKLSEAENGMSLNLLHKNMEGIDRTVSLGHARRPSVGKPAITSISNINVITKAELTANSNSERERIGPQIKNRLTYVSKKLGFKPRSGKTANSDRKETTKENRTDLPETSQSGRNISSASTQKRNRRLSLMGENLPMYIRKQLEEPKNNESDIKGVEQHAERTSVRTSPQLSVASSVTRESKKPSVSKHSKVGNKNHRIKNLLMNSQSLYAHNKDLESIKSSNKDSPVTTTNNSGSLTEGDGESDLDDDNREYISPNSINRFYDTEGEYEGNNGLKDLGTDEVEFINVNDSYNELIEGDGNDEDDKEEEEEDYLFQI